MKKDLIVQIHVPFCVRRCAHCAHRIVKYEPGLAARYVRALLRELEAAAPDAADCTVRAVSLEGGSPALLAASDLQDVLRALRRRFSLAEDVQIAIQTMPGDYSRALMEKLRDAGVNLWTVGLATADPREHALLRRPYRFDALTMVDAALRTFHPRDLGFDLLCGIPGQTERTWAHTLDAALAYRPDLLTLRPLTIARGSALYEDCALGLLAPVPEDAQREWRARAHERLTALGYEARTPIDYALPGKTDRFREGQRAGVEQLGLGYGATTVMDGLSYCNGHTLDEYLEHPTEPEVLACDVTAAPGPESRSVTPLPDEHR